MGMGLKLQDWVLEAKEFLGIKETEKSISQISQIDHEAVLAKMDNWLRRKKLKEIPKKHIETERVAPVFLDCEYEWQVDNKEELTVEIPITKDNLPEILIPPIEEVHQQRTVQAQPVEEPKIEDIEEIDLSRLEIQSEPIPPTYQMKSSEEILETAKANWIKEKQKLQQEKEETDLRLTKEYADRYKDFQKRIGTTY